MTKFCQLFFLSFFGFASLNPLLANNSKESPTTAELEEETSETSDQEDS